MTGDFLSLVLRGISDQTVHEYVQKEIQNRIKLSSLKGENEALLFQSSRKNAKILALEGGK